MSSRINWDTLEKYIVRLDKETVKIRDSRFIVSCPDCQNERIVTYCSAVNYVTQVTTGKCHKCSKPKKEKIKKIDRRTKTLQYRNLFDNPSKKDFVKTKMKQAKLGLRKEDTNRWLGRSQEEASLIKRLHQKKYRERRMKCQINRLIHSLRNRTRYLLLKKLSFSNRIGCSSDVLRHHIEIQFKSGMSWENYGKVWVVDHIYPIGKAKKLNDYYLLKSFNYKNLQPLFLEDNNKKRDKIVTPEGFLDSL